MSSEYDIEKYDREREERIKHLETLREQPDEELIVITMKKERVLNMM